MVSNMKREELAKTIMELSKTSWFESIRHDDDEKALILVDEIIKAGWVPIEDFPEPDTNGVYDVNSLYPQRYYTPEQEIDWMDRIISGLPNRRPTNLELSILHENGRIEFNPPITDETWDDVQKIEPVSEEPPLWMPVPDFENYEICKDGRVRSKWTKRILDVEFEGCTSYVDMHDKQGFSCKVSTMTLAAFTDDIFG